MHISTILLPNLFYLHTGAPLLPHTPLSSSSTSHNWMLSLTGIWSFDFRWEGCYSLTKEDACTMSGARRMTVEFWDRETTALIGFQPVLEQESNHVHRTVFHSNVKSVCEDEGRVGFVFHGGWRPSVRRVHRVQPVTSADPQRIVWEMELTDIFVES